MIVTIQDKTLSVVKRIWQTKRGKYWLIISLSAILMFLSSFLAEPVPDYNANIFNTLVGYLTIQTVFVLGLLVCDYFERL